MVLVRRPPGVAAGPGAGRGAWLAAFVLLAAACGENPTGPTPDPSDVELTNEEFAVIRAALVANTDLVSDVARVRVVVDTLGVPLPADLLGATFEWDEALDGYAPTEDGSAPADGLRFVLYDRTESPIVPFGFVDVTGEADVSPRALGVLLAKEELTRLDYLVEVDSPEARRVTAAGFLTGGTRRVDFDVEQVTSEASDGFRIDLDYTLGLADRPLTLVLDFSLNLSLFAPSTNLVATFVNGDDELIIDFVQLADNSIDGEVLWNGERLMVVTDRNGQPLFLGPGGEDLEPADVRAIAGLLDFALGGLDELLPYLIIPIQETVLSRAGALQSSSTSSNRAMARGSSDWPSQK